MHKVGRAMGDTREKKKSFEQEKNVKNILYSKKLCKIKKSKKRDLKNVKNDPFSTS